MKIYLVNELTRFMEPTIDISNTNHGAYRFLDDAKKAFDERKAAAFKDIDNHKYLEDEEMRFEIYNECNGIEISIEEVELKEL